jgi:sucrose phosphorylase
LPIVRDQLELIRLRNQSMAFEGEMTVVETEPHLLHITWRHPEASATLKADLRTHSFAVCQGDGATETALLVAGSPVVTAPPDIDGFPCETPA